MVLLDGSDAGRNTQDVPAARRYRCYHRGACSPHPHHPLGQALPVRLDLQIV